MKLAEATRRVDADEQYAQTEREDVACRPRMKNSDVRDEQISNNRVKEAPKNVDR